MRDEQYFHKRIMKRDRLRSKVRRLENKMRRLYHFFRFCFVLALLYGLYKFANASFLYLPNNIFETGKNVEILGNSIVSDKKILNELKKVPIENKPLYKINPKEMETTLERLSPIKSVYIRRFLFPSRLVIMVQEVIPAIVIAKDENSSEEAVYSIDKDFIDKEYLPIKNKPYAVKVLSTEQDYKNWDLNKIRDIYRLTKEIEYYAGEKVKYLDLRMPNNAYVQLQTVKIRLGTIDPNVFERIKQLSSMLASNEVKKLSNKTNFIDLSWRNVSYINVSEE